MVHRALACLLVVPLLVGSAAAATFAVDRTDDTASATACTAAANDCSLRGAIIKGNMTAGADVIDLPAGTYNLTIPGAAEDAAATGDLDITDSLTITGAGAATTTVDAGAFDRVFHSDPGGTGTISVTIQDLTIQGGATQVISFVLADGGAVRNGSSSTLGGNNAGTLTLMNCVIKDSTTPRAGGGLANVGTMNLIGCSVTGNTAGTNGGGLFQDDAGTLSLTDTTVSGNTGTGGGIFAGVFSITANPTVNLTRSTVSGNTGVGVYINRGVANFFNSTISGNSSTGIQDSSSQALSMRNCTVSGNVGGLSVNASFLASNSILAGNGTDCSGTLTITGYDLIQSNACTLVGSQATSIIGQAANLGALADNGGLTRTHALLPGSPAIDAGNPGTPGSGGTTCETTDQRGTARPQPVGGRCDIGAFELIPPPTTTTTTSTSTTTTSTSTSTTSTSTTSAPTTTTTLQAAEICGDCIDNDGNGQTDFEDPACCGTAESALLTLKRAKVKPGTAGTASIAVSAAVAKTGLAAGKASIQELFVQLRTGVGEILCAHVPASNLTRKRTRLLFNDKKHLVPTAEGLDRVILSQKKSGSGTLAFVGRKATLTTPAAGRIDVVLTLRDATVGNPSNQCAKGGGIFRPGAKGSIKFP